MRLAPSINLRPGIGFYDRTSLSHGSTNQAGSCGCTGFRVAGKQYSSAQPCNTSMSFTAVCQMWDMRTSISPSETSRNRLQKASCVPLSSSFPVSGRPCQRSFETCTMYRGSNSRDLLCRISFASCSLCCCPFGRRTS